MSQLKYEVSAFWDKETQVWVAESESVPSLATEAETLEALTQKLRTLALLYSWSLTEATLRLVAENEGLTLERVDPPSLVKHLATEGVISRSEYQLLMNVFFTS